jgi:DNA polymerase I-like protein with 3'-5' exonuclease and polymerase domains
MQLSMFMPQSDWRPPDELPDLRNQSNVSIDLETKDDGLAAGRGTGWARNAVKVAGMGIAWGEPGQVQGQYFPCRHPGSTFTPEQIGNWLRDHLRDPATKFHFHNGPYDLGCMRAEWGLLPPARIEDTTAKAVLINENRPTYKLDPLCQAYGLAGKDEALLREAGAAMGIKPGELKARMWQMDAKYVGPYGEAEPIQTLELSYRLERELEEQELRDAYQLEMDLIPMIQEMRWRGMRVDTERAEEAAHSLRQQRNEVLSELGHRLARPNITIDMCRSPQFLEHWHDAEGIHYPRTPKTRRGSFTADWMRKHEHWLPRLVARADQLEEAASKFIEGFILSYAHRGRLHADINQFRSDEGGTRTHRFSYSDPALQQMPGDKQAELKALVRGLFLPEPGERWGALDYSQQEYRLIVHYACRLGLSGAAEARERYLQDAKTDFHQMVADMTGLPRRNAKDVNFAKVYGAGLAQFASMTGLTRERAEEVMAQYDKQLPFPRALDAECKTVARRTGYIIMLDGARMHFDRWEPAEWDDRDGSPLNIAAARKRWPGKRLVRAFTHKAMNGLIQGGAARQTKSAMRDCWREKLVPLIQMHDELSFSFSREKDARRAQELMRETRKLEVPMLVDAEFGRDWGDAKHTWREAEVAA